MNTQLRHNEAAKPTPSAGAYCVRGWSLLSGGRPEAILFVMNPEVDR